jgi:hypothetical protein
MLVDPRQTAQVEAVLGAADRDVGEAGFGGLDITWQGLSRQGGVLRIDRFGEVVGDPDGGPLATFGGVCGGNGDLGLGLGGEFCERLQHHFDAMFVDHVDERQQVASVGVPFDVVLHFTPGGKQQ